MIILDNIIFELQKVGGISKFWIELIKRFNHSSLDMTFLEGRNINFNIFRKNFSHKKEVFFEKSPLLFRRILNVNYKCEIFHSSYYRVSTKAKYNLVTIHDLMNEKFPKNYKDVLLSMKKKHACKKADIIFTVSKKTKSDLLELYDFVEEENVKVVYNGVSKEFYHDKAVAPFIIEQKQLIPKKYFLYVGTRGFCKNFSYVLKFFHYSLKNGCNNHLVIVTNSPLSKQENDYISRIGISTSRIITFQNISSDELRKLYSNCLAMLMPSIYEGFGIPAAEAARCGALVLSSKNSAIEEIIGKSEYSFNIDLKGEIERVFSLGFRNEKSDIERNRVLARSKKFNWDNSASEIEQVYRKLIGR